LINGTTSANDEFCAAYGDASYARSVAKGIRFSVGEQSRFGKREVTAIGRGGEKLHTDLMETADAFRRQKFFQTLEIKLGLNVPGPLTDEEMEHYSRTGKGPETDIDRFKRWDNELLAAAGTPGADGTTTPRILERLTTEELIATAERPQYLIPGILVAGQPGVLGGSHKTLKTSVGADLAISLATGGYFLGCFHVPEAVRVGFLSGESGQATMAETVDRICHAAGLNPRINLDGVVWSMRVPKLRDLLDQDALRRFIENDNLRLLLLDPLYLALAGIGNEAANLYSMAEFLDPLGEIGADTGCTILMLHHTSRGATRERGFGPATLDMLTYGGTPEFVRQWLLLSRRAEYVPGTGHHELWLSAGGSAGHSGLWSVDIDEGAYDVDQPRVWQTSVRNATEARQVDADANELAKQKKADEQLDRDKRSLLDTVLRCPDKRGTKEDIRARWPHSYQALRRALAACISGGELMECDIQKTNRKTPYPGYRLGE
jgi:hypothetical protein